MQTVCSGSLRQCAVKIHSHAGRRAGAFRLSGHVQIIRDTRMRAGNEPDKSIEDLFAEELKKRGLDSMDNGETARESTGAATSTSTSKSPFQSATQTTQRTKPAGGDEGDQRQRSMALVSEGLEGLIPRASELLKLGSSIFLAFAPFILAISLMFGGIYYVFGDHFVHGGGARSGPPAYVDPERLLSEPTVDPYIPFQ